MKIKRIEVLINNGSVPGIPMILNEIQDAIKTVSWPEGNNSFVINPVRKGNGVKPIKNSCMRHLHQKGWALEHPVRIKAEMRPGPLDAVKMIGGKAFALEWETGNISSSHRAINKMVMGMLERVIIGGVLILPSRDMYNYLTDRVGNFRELEPYFSVWRQFNLKDAYLAIVEIEHDSVDAQVSLIPKGTDGRAIR
uniref:Type II restriction enzyme OkrAI n=1 Tax=Oceanobacter kriegii TaxID=64972 RepID=T2OK1_OCEKR|nr:OkrAI restriction enzyme [Oceanobacter kriegii]3ODH_A Chain A, OkrAI endonuclease [Oceanobacter kriegii]3ODH_B Chain B, OkrAI endonuclease [Oceanobacter kriegii]3ODH_E Chain E, OkrAI endonuclease [Oceanobacter kriegii]3ODH_F Chain F, OkrAI endonuclease [Oceanobacter kriegii]